MMRHIGFIVIVLLGCKAEPLTKLTDVGINTANDSSDDGSKIDSLWPSCDGQETTLQGKVLAPNGTDPVPGASVFVPASVPQPFAPEVRCEVCGTSSSTTNLWATTTQFDGSFSLTNVCPGSRTIVFQNGRFRRVIQIEVPASTVLDVPASQSRLPTKNGENHPSDSIPRVAVATGDYDKMECVLRKIGLADGSYELFEGSTQLQSPTPLPHFSELVNNLEKMKSYNIIFINCTKNTFESELDKPEVRQKLESYVQAGGRLYVTDWSYDWIEQLAMLSPFIDFEPGASTSEPEGANAAELGAGGLHVDATIKDPQMAQWLGLFPGSISGGMTPIEHFADDWVIMHALHEDAKVWVEGPISSAADVSPGIQGVRPLTVTFNYENCGKILFSSYHTEGRMDELFPGQNQPPSPKVFPKYCSPQFSPQDRILEYLIFDIANCIEPIK